MSHDHIPPSLVGWHTTCKGQIHSRHEWSTQDVRRWAGGGCGGGLVEDVGRWAGGGCRGGLVEDAGRWDGGGCGEVGW